MSEFTESDSEPVQPEADVAASISSPATTTPDSLADPESQPAFWPHRVTWLLSVTALLLATTWVVPYTVEQIEYARERGRQKAQVDVATVALRDQRLPLEELSKAYQLVSQRVGPSVVHINVTEDDSETKSDGRDRPGEFSSELFNLIQPLQPNLSVTSNELCFGPDDSPLKPTGLNLPMSLAFTS